MLAVVKVHNMLLYKAYACFLQYKCNMNFVLLVAKALRCDALVLQSSKWERTVSSSTWKQKNKPQGCREKLYEWMNLN